MGVKLKAGIALGVIVGVWMLIFGFTGMYKNPNLGWAFTLVAIILNVGVLIWGLRQTAAEKGYGGQLGTAIVIALIGGVIIIGCSMLFTTVLFPDSADIALENAVAQMEAQGMDETQMEAGMKVAEVMVSPAVQAAFGFVGTMITSLIAGLILAAIFRKR